MSDYETARSTTNEPVHSTTTTTRSGGSSGVAFVVGALVVVVGILAYVMFGGDADTASGANDINVTIEGAGDAANDAGQAIQGAAESAGDAVEGAANSVGNAADESTTGN